MRFEWKTMSLGDVCSVTSSKRIFANEYQTTGIPFYRGKEIIEKHNGNKVSTELFISKERFEEIKSKFDVPQKGDILLSSVGTLGIPWYVDETDFYFKDGNLTWLRADIKQIDSRFLYLWLNSIFAQEQINQMCIGSTQKALTIDTLKKFKIELPPMQVQKKIVSVLWNILHKITVNTAINENLEQQAQAIFKSWFVDFEPFGGVMPEDWYIGNISDLAKEIICGKTPSTKKKEYYGDYMPFITIPDIHNSVYAISTERYLSELGAKSQEKKTIHKNSICVSCIGTAGLVVLVADDSQTNQQINSIVPKDNYSPYYIYLLMQTMSEKINRLGQSGSTIVNLNKKQFGIMEALVPSIISMNDFDSLVQPLFEQILTNQQENQNLAALRDSLLPKLMNGEIDVSAVKI